MRYIYSMFICVFTALAAPSDYVQVLSGNTYQVAGTFGQHDFVGVDTAFDWAFTVSGGDVYQLQGLAATENDVFGWKPVAISSPEPAWYMIYVAGDPDGDGTSRFDWFLIDPSGSLVYKLAGVSDSGNFQYEGPIDVEASFSTTYKSVVFHGSDASSSSISSSISSAQTSEVKTFKLEAWADNWFAAYLEENLIVEDSVPITVERSFNAETAIFSGSYPLYLNFILKDFKENDTGLEYIGQQNQQMGDGGFIMQISDESTGQIVAVSNDAMKCRVIHKAPLDKSCENTSNPIAGVAPCMFEREDEPTEWKLSSYDDSSWENATPYTTAQVGPKEGYYEITWDSAATLIWGGDLETDNTILCRLKVENPSSGSSSSLSAAQSSSASPTGSFSITSKALKRANQLPFSYTCDGLNSAGERGGRAPTISFVNPPEQTVSYVLTMHIMKGAGDKIDREVLWVLYNIPSSTTTLDESDIDHAAAGTLGISEQGNNVYFPPCSKDPIENSYTITAYALSDTLDIPAQSATFDAITAAAQSKALAATTLDLVNVRYNPEDEAQPFVPTKVPVTCNEKTAAFAFYDTTTVACDEANNRILVTSTSGIPERSSLDADKLNVGTEAWIGRVPLTSETTWNVPMTPAYLAGPANNINIHNQIGITVDGIPMLHYAKEASPDEIADLSTDYTARDTVLLGELDQCGGHAGNGEDYHYHYLPICMMDTHDPSQPLAYMFDGLPLYFGTGGGTVTGMSGGITSVNYGGGRYNSLNYLPADARNGTNPLDACNAYDLNGDGAASGYVYYTSKEAPYTIGCFRAEADQKKSVASYPRWDVERDISWSGADVLLSDYYTESFEGKTWFFMEITPDIQNNKIPQGQIGVILWRELGSGESGYEVGRSCWAFRYRLDKTDTQGINDTTATHCRG